VAPGDYLTFRLSNRPSDYRAATLFPSWRHRCYCMISWQKFLR